MSELRLGDVIDDYCVKCRRITNHSVVSIINEAPAKVRCRTCYNDHDFRHEQAPPSKKELKKQELFREVLAAVAPSPDAEAEAAAEVEAVAEAPAPVVEKKKARGKRAEAST